MATGTQMAAKDTDQIRDTEITLSTGKLLGMFFALAIICAVFFTMGYLLGKSTSAGGRTEIVATVPSNSAGKPYAGNKTPEAVTQTCPPGSPNCEPVSSTMDTNPSASGFAAAAGASSAARARKGGNAAAAPRPRTAARLSLFNIG